MTFADDLKKAKAAKTPHEDVPVLIAGTLHTLRFSQMDGLEWAAETDRHPIRQDVAVDGQFGYNVRTLTVAVALASGARMEGAQAVPLSEEEWQETFAAISGAEFQAITDAIWGLNEMNPRLAVARAVDMAKKARARSPKASA